MTKLTAQVKSFMNSAKQSIPTHPTIPDEKTRILRIRLIWEELLEFVEASGVSLAIKSGGGFIPIDRNTEIDCVTVSTPDLLEAADALGDLLVVTEGANITWGFNGEKFTDAIMENNFTKFVDGWIDEHGKLRKGPSYKPVNLQPVLEEQIKNGNE